MLSARGAEIWDTAVQYHLIHALALAFAGTLQNRSEGTAPVVAAWGFALGVLLFSGSLYLLALGGPSFFGPITPLGGVAFIVGWLALAASAVGRSEQ